MPESGETAQSQREKVQRLKKYAEYVNRLNVIASVSGSTPELSLRPAMQELLETLLVELKVFKGMVIPEVRAFGQPDYIVKAGEYVVGYLETKRPGLSLAPTSDQLVRYISNLGNVIVTDFLDFNLYRDGRLIKSAALAKGKISKGQLVSLDDIAIVEVDALLQSFFAYRQAGVRTAKQLAALLAQRALLLRDAVREELNASSNSLQALFHFYRTALYDGMTGEIFADTIAQTLTYAMFLARLEAGASADFTIRNARYSVPETVPFLRGALKVILDEDELSERIAWVIEDVVSLLRATDISTVAAEISAAGSINDAILYFYEPFLHAYDAQERIDRGVYYTPEPLVSYIVSCVDELLITRFAKNLGLASSDITILDPAVGTGTFLVAGMKQAAKRVAETEGQGAVSLVLAERIQNNYIGFEVLPAPYTIAHLRLARLFDDLQVPEKRIGKFRVFLTNTVAAPTTRPQPAEPLPILQNLLDEVISADKVKAEERILVIWGNPPYDRDSRFNKSPFIERLLADFKTIDGQRLGERSSRSLNDDYVKFFRWAFNKLLELESSYRYGIVAFVSNNGYVDGTSFKGMRKWMVDNFDELYIYNLHGDQREWIRGRVDEKVFEQVQAGIAVTIAVRSQVGGSAQVKYRETRGTRSEKFAEISAASLDEAAWSDLQVAEPSYVFVPRDAGAYETWASVHEIFVAGSVGIQTSNDDLVVSFVPEDAPAKITKMRSDSGLTDSQVREQFDIVKSRWERIKQLRGRPLQFNPDRIVRYLYRQMDYRYLYLYEPLIARSRREVTQHLVDGKTVALVCPRNRRGDGQGAVTSNAPVDLNVLGSGVYMYPMRQIALEQGTEPIWNVAPRTLTNLRNAIGGVTEEGIFFYVFAMLASRAYANRYGKEWQRDHPRIPFPTSLELFEQIAEMGRNLSEVQLLRTPQAKLKTKFEGSGEGQLSLGHYDTMKSSIALNETLRLGPISQGVWQYKIGQHYVLERFIQERIGKTLDSDLRNALRQIVHALTRTLELMSPLDNAIEKVLGAPL